VEADESGRLSRITSSRLPSRHILNFHVSSIIGGKIPAINGIYLNFASYIHLHSFRPWPCTMHRPWTMPPPEQLLHNRPPHILTSRPSIGIQNEDPLRRTRGPHAIHISCSITSLLQWIFCHDTKTKPAAEGEGFHSTSRRRHGR